MFFKTKRSLLRRKRSFVFGLICCMAISPAIATAKQAPEKNIAYEAALKPVKSKFFDEFLVAEKASMANYTKFFIAQPSVSFDKRWLRDHRTDVSRKYKEKTLLRYTDELKEQIQKAIEKRDGLTVVSEKGEDVLTIRANIVDLDINGPDDNVFIRHYVNEAGDATFNVEIVNPKGIVVAKIRDHRETREQGFGRLERTSRLENQRDFRILMGKWSREMMDHIAMN